MRPLKALVFDAYGTLFDVHSVAGECERLFPGHGQALSQLWRSKQLEYSWLRSLMGRYVDFNRVTADALRYACAALGLDYSEEVLAELNRAYRTLAPFPDARLALEALQRDAPGMRLAILSNGAPDMLLAVVKNSRLESAFDAVLSVDAAGTFKPVASVYRLAEERLRYPASEMGFVSSNGWDAAGAKAFGFTVFWVNRLHAPVEGLGLAPDHILSSLEGLPRLVAP